ncbi:MAG TPA: lysoplasmalogenase, partial [Thermomicrobiales bacterium]
ATTLIFLLALNQVPEAARGYALAILLGLLCSLAGNVVLMLPGDRFVAGLVSFLLAHIAYIVAFVAAPEVRFTLASSLTLLPLILYGTAIFWRLMPHLGGVRLPVFVYLLVTVAMAWCAVDRWRVAQTTSAASAALGGLLFVISDSTLAWNRFIGRFRSAQAIVLGTYFMAQWLIALSV